MTTLRDPAIYSPDYCAQCLDGGRDIRLTDDGVCPRCGMSDAVPCAECERMSGSDDPEDYMSCRQDSVRVGADWLCAEHVSGR